MSNKYLELIDITKVVANIARFELFVHEMDGHLREISFHDSTGYLCKKEDYKSQISEIAKERLNLNKWSESLVGEGVILEHVKNAINKSDNLLDPHQKTDFKNRLRAAQENNRIKEVERVLYDIYKNPDIDEQIAFENTIKEFGAKYDTIAFLFFVKDNSRFLPIRPTHFDESFKLLDINFSTERKCSWKNYQQFLGIVDTIRELLEDMLPMRSKPQLIDAHSFMWIIHLKEFKEWEPNKKQVIEIEKIVEEHLQKKVTGVGGQKDRVSRVYNRSTEVVKETRKRANGICQYCKQPAPFNDRKGNPYLEVHHVIWLSRGGEDSTDNTVALCPNCHTRMHVLDEQKDVELLKQSLSMKE